jgi:hypothetical protein
MVPEKLQQIVRQFSENGLKLLLENPRNVVDLLGLSVPDIVQMIEPGRLKTIQTTFVGSDYRHVESDVVLVAPLRRAKAKRLLRRLLIYILIEHQSEPDRLMPLRALDYVVQIYRYQVREWSKTHRSFSRIRFDPVLPVVFYTGTRRWDSPGRLIDLVDLGDRFESVTPAFEPLFINLPEIPAETLESQGGYFGSVCDWSSSGRPGPASSRNCWTKWSSTWRRCRTPSVCAGWNCFPTSWPWYIMQGIRPSSQNCRKRSNPRFGRTYIARRFSRCEERLPTNWRKKGL